MSPIENFDDLLLEHRALQRKMPRTWNAFFAGFASLRPVQLKAMPPISEGKNVLVVAPTAGGKTQAAMAPVCERLLKNKWGGLSVLVITPTRALVNDLFIRLTKPLDNLRISLGRKTADHGLGEEIREQVLITTPESTESLLTFRRETLDNVKAIVLDEIHLLDGSPRGDQLRAILSRLLAYRQHLNNTKVAGVQRVAMSATVSDPKRLAEAYLGSESTVIRIPGHRDIQSKTILVTGGDKERAEAAIAETSSFEEVHKILAFVNSRKQVDEGTGYFRHGRFSTTPVYGHHGSLSKSQREDVEFRFKNDSEGICVATMTLEVGIDIGDIDLVICMDPPFSLSSFLQRIGRGCRRLNGLTRVLCVARDRASELIFEALIRQASIGVPAGPLPPFRRSVLIQQSLAYLRQVPKQRRVADQFKNVVCSATRPQITESCVEGVLDGMVQSELLDCRNGIYQPASDGRQFIESTRIYSNIDSNRLEVTLVDVETGKPVVTVARVSDDTQEIRVGGKTYSVLPGRCGWRRRIRAGGQHGESPNYFTRTLPYSFEIGAALAGRFGVDPRTLLVIRDLDTLVVMTWLGRLLNSALALSLQNRGIQVVDGPFHLAIATESDDLLDLIKEAAADVVANNPMDGIRPERYTDVGPHFSLLSPEQQKRAREDWLDKTFLHNWADRIHQSETVTDPSRIADLMELL